MMSDYIIRTDGLSFKYSKHKQVLDNVSIHVPKGSIYGFLGPNGAGKSTTMRLLTGIIPQQGNAIHLFGQPLKDQLPEVFLRMGALVESPALYLHLSGIDNLRYIAKIRKVDAARIPEVLELVGLSNDGGRKVKQYSLGMKQRLAIGIALLDEPELLLLDEPVNGLDPAGIVDIRKLLVRISKEKGTTIFVSSHLLSEIEKMCTHIGIINRGKLRFEGTMDELYQKFEGCTVQLTIDETDRWFDTLSAKYTKVQRISDEQLSVELTDRAAVPTFISGLIHERAQLYEVRLLDRLEDLFMTITDEK